MRTFNRHVSISIALLFIFISTSARAQDGGTASNTLNAKVDAVFARYDKPDSPGCALGVIKDGQIAYARGYGMANLEHNIPNGPKLVYDIGSTSKQFSAASILLLAQQGKLSLDDDVRKHIPELPAYQKPITIRHLIHHTSGLRDYLTLFSLAGVSFDDTTTEKDALDLILRQKGLNFTPGDEWLYSNSGYFLLSIIVKRASGKSLAEFAKENIFDPLGMKRTIFLDNHKRIVPLRATGYAPGRAGAGSFQTEMSNFEQTGDGAVLTSIEDLLLWDRNFYEPKVGGKTFLDQMHAVGALNNGEKLDYASGLFIDEHKGLRRVSHGGSWAGYRSDLIRFPDQKLSVVCLCNLGSTNPSRLATQVAEIYLADQLKTGAENAKTVASTTVNPETITLGEDQLKDKVGIYRNPASGEVRRISLNGGKLRIDAFGPVMELAPISANRFRFTGPGANPNAEAAFEKSSNGKTLLKLSRGGGKTDNFDSVEAFSPSAEQLNEFAGSYYSDELDVTYKMTVENDRLVAVNRSGVKRPLTPSFRDAFATFGAAQFEFNRDGQGRVAGFAVHAGRIRNVRFVKK
jgi:CubicO group peptidase (beta-lactamase class C family)